MFQDGCKHAHRQYGAVRPPPKFQRRYETAKIIINNNNNAYEDDNRTIIKFNGTLFVARPLFRSILSTFGRLGNNSRARNNNYNDNIKKVKYAMVIIVNEFDFRTEIFFLYKTYMCIHTS